MTRGGCVRTRGSGWQPHEGTPEQTTSSRSHEQVLIRVPHTAPGNNPISFGVVGEKARPRRGYAFLRRLRGPNAQPVTFERLGSCCSFPTPKGFTVSPDGDVQR